MRTPGKWSTANEGSEMCKANAQAISALPNLIEAAKDALDIVNSYSHIPALFRACQILQAAIEKTEV